jgi:hypothetical protein
VIPAPVEDYVKQALAKLTSQYATTVYYDDNGIAHFQGNAPQLAALLAAYSNQAQELEAALWGVYLWRQLANVLPGALTAPYANPSTGVGGSVIDTIGSIVGQPRLGMSDVNYVGVIYLRIAVNRSIGAIPNWSNFAAILLPTSGGPIQYYEAIPPIGYVPAHTRASAGFVLAIWDMGLNPVIVAQVLAGATPHGVNGQLHWTTWPDGDDFEWTSVYDTGTGELGWGSIYDEGQELTSALATPLSLLGLSMILGIPPSSDVDGVGGLWVAATSLTLPSTSAAD